MDGVQPRICLADENLLLESPFQVWSRIGETLAVQSQMDQRTTNETKNSEKNNFKIVRLILEPVWVTNGKLLDL